jgi:hypothetical protein
VTVDVFHCHSRRIQNPDVRSYEKLAEELSERKLIEIQTDSRIENRDVAAAISLPRTLKTC